MLKKGQVVWVELDGKGREQKGNRPCVIVQNDMGNRFGDTTIVVPLTKRIPRRLLPTHLVIKGKSIGQSFCDSTILTEQIKIIDNNRIIHKSGILPKDIIKQIDEKMMISLGISQSIS